MFRKKNNTHCDHLLLILLVMIAEEKKEIIDRLKKKINSSFESMSIYCEEKSDIALPTKKSLI